MKTAMQEFLMKDKDGVFYEIKEINMKIKKEKPLISAYDLRIGNYLFLEGNIVKAVDIRRKTLRAYNESKEFRNTKFTDIGLFTPIVLGEDTLKACGFLEMFVGTRKTGYFNQLGGDPHYGWQLQRDDYRGVYYISRFNLSMHLDRGHNLEIKYVHQLQNVYYALMGEDLTIKF